MKTVKLFLLYAVMCILFLSGCHKTQKPEEAFEDKGEKKFRELMSKLDAYMLQTNISATVELLSSSLNDPDLSAQRGWLFVMLLDVYMRNNDYGKAEQLYFDSAADSELIRAGFDAFINYFAGLSNNTIVVEWTDKVLQLDVLPDIKERAFKLKTSAIRETAGVNGVIPLVKECFDRFDDQTSARILDEMLAYFIGKDKVEDTGLLLNEIRKQDRKSNSIVSLLIKYSARIDVRKGDWKSLGQNMDKAVVEMPDNEMANLIAEIITTMRNKKEFDQADRLAARILEKDLSAKPSAHRQLVYQWLEIARDKNEADEVLNRIEKLFVKNTDPSFILSLLDRHFYWLAQNGDNAKKIMLDAEKLMPQLKDERDKASLKAMILDASFMCEDYEKSLEIIGEGIPERTPEWHEMAINKIKAHIALRDGKEEEAVERFRAFMKSVEKWERPESDPATGMLYTKEITLGKNARRIGDIWKSRGEDKRAKEAYLEARRYFEIALQDSQLGSIEKEMVEKEIKSLPQK